MSGLLAPPFYPPMRAGVTLVGLDQPCRWWRRITLRGHSPRPVSVMIEADVRDSSQAAWHKVMHAGELLKCAHCGRVSGSVSMPVASDGSTLISAAQIAETANGPYHQIGK